MEDKNQSVTPDSNQWLHRSFEELRDVMNRHHCDLVERLAERQREIVKAFQSYTYDSSKRVTGFEYNDGEYSRRLEAIENRLLEVERRLNIPPAA